MPQPEDFNGHWKILSWEPENLKYSKIVKVGNLLTISENPPGTFRLQWSDGIGVYTLNSLAYVDGTLRTGASRLRRSDQDPVGIPLTSACVKPAASINQAVTVTFVFGEDQEGPKGTFTAEADPPRPLPEGLWRRLLSLFRRLLSLFR